MPLDARSRVLSAAPSVPAQMGWELATVLATVKAYPAVARQSGESVCVAGVRLDGDASTWIRLFPVGFRDLPPDRQFVKYQVIRLRLKRGNTDRRPESWKPDLESLALGEQIGTDDGTWATRSELLEPLTATTTTCDLLTAARARGQAAPSLGLIKPADVSDLVIEDNPAFRPGRAAERQGDLFGHEEEPLAAAPFVVRYHYRCETTGCGGHEQMLVDWESGAFARRNLHLGMEEARRAQRGKFFDRLCASDRDTHFFVGNQHQRPQGLLVLGVFWPPRRRGIQQSLDF